MAGAYSKEELAGLYRRRVGMVYQICLMLLKKTIPWEAPEDGEVWQALLSLPERERTALYLHYYQGYSTEETAELMGTKPATLRTWLFRARGKLKQRLEAEGYGV